MSKWWRSPVALIRISAVLYAGTAVGHSSAYPWTSAREPQEIELRRLMNLPFMFLGEPSTYWNLYFGWGILVAVCLSTFAAILWFLSDLARDRSPAVSAIAWIISASSLVSAWISFRYFYLPPTLTYLVCAVLLAMAAAQQRRRESPLA